MGGPGMIDGQSVACVDNFLPAKFVVDGVQYFSSENYFQVQKTDDPQEREATRKSGCGADVWSAGRRVTLRPDWEAVKVRVMYEGHLAKFQQNPRLLAQLSKTRGNITFHASTAFWCHWNGIICERIRAELRGSDGDAQAAQERKELMDAFEEKMTNKLRG